MSSFASDATRGIPLPWRNNSQSSRVGRTRLERYYRNPGYRDVRVEVTGSAAPQTSDVSLIYAVHEGPLHVVRSVEIAGVQSTRTSLVNDAIWHP